MTHSYFPVHAHSRYSWLDAMPRPGEMVDRVEQHGQPGLAITDHGVMSATVSLYKLCREKGLAFFPGIELYVTQTLDKKPEPERYHTGLLALDLDGYKALVGLSHVMFDKDHFHRKPRISYSELKQFGRDHGEHLALTTGCYYSIVVQTLLKRGEKAATTMIKALAGCFPNTYVELQHHNTVHADGRTDWDVAKALHGIAVSLGLPVVVGQDSHYCDHGDKDAHEMMKKLGYSADDQSDVFFPGDSYHMATTPWIAKHFAGLRDAWKDADEGHDDLLDKNRLIIPALEKYQFLVPDLGYGDGMKELRKRVSKAMHAKAFDMADSYESRVKYELSVVEQMGFGNYFILADNFISKCRAKGILINARGSANGCFFAYALGITNVDPIYYDISFDRFLHPSRKKPPDIDFDIDRDRRPEAIEMLDAEFKTMPIGTYNSLTDANDRGSIFVKYLAYRNNIGKPLHVENLYDVDREEPKDARVLRRLSPMGLLTGGGTHAAGYIIDTPLQPAEEYLPVMRVGGINGHIVTQYDDDDCEEFGYVKMDALGLAALTTVAGCLTLIGKNPVDGLNWIRDDDKEACKLLRTGDTGTGIFQFEGYSTAVGARKMGVKSVKDAILALALFRPAAMDSGATDAYLHFRKSKEQPRYVHEIFEQVTKDTYGVFVIQDQVIDVLRRLGLSHEDLNDMLKAVKMSNHNIPIAQRIFARVRPLIEDLCGDVGMTRKQAVRATDLIMSFSDYGFNKAHATSYGLLAYRMAWLKSRYPQEFMVSLLATWAGDKKERVYLSEARKMGLRIGKADVNTSQMNWSLDGDILRRGLLSIPHVGAKAAQEVADNQPFKSMEDMIERCSGTTGMVTGGKTWAKDGTLNGVLGHLKDAGALKSVLAGSDDE